MPEVDDVKVSSGATVARGDTVHLLYRVALSRHSLFSGPVIESNYSPEVPIAVIVKEGELLPGVFAGLLGMHESGSVRVLHLSPDEAFGATGYGEVPPSSELWVELCVVRIEKAPTPLN